LSGLAFTAAFVAVLQLQGGLDAVSVTAWATAALAFVGAVSIGANAFLIRVASAEARASQDLVQETKRDRELAHRPFLTYLSPFQDPLAAPAAWTLLSEQLTQLTGVSLPRTEPLSVRVGNIGNGLAIDCQYVALFTFSEESMDRRLEAVYVSERAALAAGGGPIDLTARPLESEEAPPAIKDLTEPSREGAVEALMCSDIFEKRYRFVRGKPIPQVWPDDYAGKPRPDWSCAGSRLEVPAPNRPPSPSFSGALNANPGFASIGIVLEGAPHRPESFDSEQLSAINDWLVSAGGEGRISTFGPDCVIGTFVTSPNEPESVVRIVPGPMISIHRQAPGAPERFRIVRATDWWCSTMVSATRLLDCLEVKRTYLGIFYANLGAEGLNTEGFDFAPAPAPRRVATDIPRRPWSAYFPSPVPVTRLDPRLITRLEFRLWEAYSYLDCESAFDWLERHVLDSGLRESTEEIVNRAPSE
jgi:hypothetical protein